MELAHVEGGLRVKPAMCLRYGASPANGAACRKAILPAQVKVVMAGGKVISVLPKGADGAGGEAGRGTSGAGRGRRWRQVKALRQGERAAIRQEKPLHIMDQKPYRRGVRPPAAQCPLEEGAEGWPAEGKQRLRPKALRHAANDAGRPAVQRIGGTVTGFGLRGEMLPEARPVLPEEEERACAFGQIILRPRMETAEDGEVMWGKLRRHPLHQRRGLTRGSVERIRLPAP